MLSDSLGARKLKAYIKDYRRESFYCENCHKIIYRVFFVLNGKPLKRKAIAEMNQKVDEKSWLEVKKKLNVLCRFCCNTYDWNSSEFFNYTSFSKYLFLYTKLGPSSILEYTNRLRRIEKILISTAFKMHCFSIEKIENELNRVMDLSLVKSLSIVLKKYNDFLIWNVEGGN